MPRAIAQTCKANTTAPGCTERSPRPKPDPRLKEVYGRLAAVEEGHAEFWRRQLDRIGVRAAALGLGWRTRALAWLARRFGPQLVLPTVNTLEQRDVGQYDDQAEAVAHGLPAAERSHARIVRAIEAVRRRHRRLPGSTLWRVWKAGIARWAGTRCAPPCSARMTGSSRI